MSQDTERDSPSEAATPASSESAAPPLDAAQRRRGRALAIGSHPFGMTFNMVFTSHLPTLALVSLGASEAMVGLQSAFGAADLLRLPTLRAVSTVSKRTILMVGQLAAMASAIPLLFFPWLLARAEAGASGAIAIALGAFAAITAFSKVADTVWFPLLRSYVEPERIGRFFGTIRSGWHFALIVYYVGASFWLASHPDRFGVLFAVAWGCGWIRVLLIRRLPERSERTGERIRAREAWALILHEPDLRRYLIGSTIAAAVRGSVIPFLIVLMRREIGFGEGEILIATVASFAGGLASLYLWGRAVDLVGPEPIFRWTSLAAAGAIASLVFVEQATPSTLVGLIGFFFVLTVLASGFGVADTHVLFRLTPADAPARTLVIAAVVVSVASSAAPLAVGITLDRLLAGIPEDAEGSRLVVYHGFFLIAAAVRLCAYWPLRGFSDR